MRLTWYSNTPLAGTGYGVETAEIVPRINADGHPIAVICNWGHFATPLEWIDGIPLFPAGKDKYSNDIVRAHYGAWKSDYLITLYDTWPLIRSEFPEKVASWVPIDHEPVPPQVLEWCQQVTPITMSRFGQRMLRDQGVESTYIPHCVNTQVFKPTDRTRQGPPRELFGIPADAFVVMIAAANIGLAPPRKAWPEMFMAASYFMRQHPDAYLFLHTDMTQSPPSGLDLDLLAQAVDMPLDRMKAVDSYAYATGGIHQVDLAAFYTTADVLLASSMGEGFGIPVMEAQACGTPVIVSDFSAQPELAASGWLVKGQPEWDPLQNSWFFKPFVHAIVARLEEAYAARGDEQRKVQAIAKAAEYDTAKVYDQYWRPFLKQLEAKLTPPAPIVRKPNRAERRAKKGKAA